MTEAVTGLGMQLYVYKTQTEIIRIPQITTVPDIGSAPQTMDTTNKDNKKYKSYIEGLQDPGALEFSFIIPPMNAEGTDPISQIQSLEQGKQYGCAITNPKGGWKVNLTASLSFRFNSNTNDDVQTGTVAVTVSDMSDYIFFEAFEIRYDSNRGQGVVPNDPNFYEPSENVIVLDGAELFFGSKDFTSWNTARDGQGTKYLPGAIINLSANTTLFAQYGEEPEEP